jgi:class 3 adenylate cyclase/DNA-binding CsgD family transcriptional regulator
MGDVTARTATFLFTDIEGSTQLLKRLRKQYASVLARHQQLLREAFTAFEGTEVDTQGDSFFFTFPRVKDAVLAAVAGRRALVAETWPRGVEVWVRMGIHTGEAAVAEERPHGLSVHRAARICQAAHGGQILMSQTARDVLEDEEGALPGVELRDLGEVLLKDLDRPVRLSELVVSLPSAPTGGEAEPVTEDERILPTALRSTPAFPFVGRSPELAALSALLPLAAGVRGRVSLLSGESGSGKTRLVREFAHEAAARGVLVLYGASDAVVNTPYQPFVEALDFLTRQSDPDRLRAELGASGGELTRLLPDLPNRAGPLPKPVAADPDTERHRLHTAVSDLLAGVGRRRPLLLVVDDAHWADAPSLHLFRHLARTCIETSVLLLATFREREPDVRPEFSEALADLSRTEGVTRVRLGGLSDEDVGEFVRRSAGARADAELSSLATALVDLTDGNPFLLCELWRTLVETGAVNVTEGRLRMTRTVAELGSPESVRDVITHRLARLAPETTALLEVAAVLGREFELGVLGDAAGLGERELAPAVETAVRSGVIEEVPGSGLAYRFTHELVRRALYDRLSGIRRAELHLRAAEALERLHAASPGRVLSEVAHHFAVAAPVGGKERAIDYNLRAADAALASLAFEEAATRLSQALELGIADRGLRAQIQLRLGSARVKAGETLAGLESFTAAAKLARSLGDGELLARAAIGFEDAAWAPLLNEGAVELLQEAVDALGEDDSALMAGLLAALSRELLFGGQHDEATEARTQAIAIARRLDDPRTLATTLIQAYWARTTTPLEDVLAMLTEARELGGELGDPAILAEATAWRLVTLVGLCDLDAARDELAALHRVAEETRQPLWLHIAEQFGSALALCDGRLDEAEQMANRSWAWRPYLRGRDPSGVYGVQLFGIRREQGRLAELRPALELFGDREDGTRVWGPGLVALLEELGFENEAREELRHMRVGGFAEIPRDSLWLASLSYLTDACAALGDADSAAVLYPELERFGGGNVQIAQLVACYGSADRYLGMLATVLRRWPAAEAHFEYALYLNRRMSAHTWTAHTAYEYARMLLVRRDARDLERASELLSEAEGYARRLGLTALVGKVEALEAAPVALKYPDDLSPREVEVLLLVARGRSNREIGQELFISEHTAANHVRNILRKTSSSNRTDAAAYAYRHGLVRL